MGLGYALISLALITTTVDSQVEWRRSQKSHQPRPVDDRFLRELAGLENKEEFQALLDPILVRRIPGEPAHAEVQKHIIRKLEAYGWTVETIQHEAKTPIGTKPFTNIVGTLHPNAPRKVVLACHY